MSVWLKKNKKNKRLIKQNYQLSKKKQTKHLLFPPLNIMIYSLLYTQSTGTVMYLTYSSCFNCAYSAQGYGLL